MTYKEAAIRAFEIADNEPKTAKEIWDIIDEHGLKESSGKTPWASLRVKITQLSNLPYESKENTYNGDPIFKRHTDPSPDTFCLIEENENHEEDTEEQKEIEETIEEAVETVTEVTSPEINWRKIIVKNNNGNLEYTVEDCDRYTYFVKGNHGEKIKIGTTTQTPDKRVKGMQTSHPMAGVEVAIPASVMSESEAHERFDNARHRGEWFFFTKRLREFIEKKKDLVDKVTERFDYEDKMRRLDEEILELDGS